MGYDDDEDEEMHTHILYVKKFIIFIFLFRVEQVLFLFKKALCFIIKKTDDYEEKKNLS